MLPAAENDGQIPATSLIYVVLQTELRIICRSRKDNLHIYQKSAINSGNIIFEAGSISNFYMKTSEIY